MAVKRSQIENKDLSDNVSKISTDQLDALKNQLRQTVYTSLLANSSLSFEEWNSNQLNNRRGLIKQIKDISRSQTKKILDSLNGGLEMLELSPKQTKEIRVEVKNEIKNLNQLVVREYTNLFTEIASQMVLKSGVTDSLFNIIQDKITKTNDLGLVVYKGGRKVRWENHMEMKLRTDIQNDIANNMVKTGLENGVVFYICSYHGDCAEDHAEYQGKIYYDKNWKSNVGDEKTKQSIQSYIDKHSLMTIQNVMDKPVYLTSRPNCRHYFQYISIDEVLAIKNSDDLNNKRKEYNLNSKGKYEPEKYNALKEQRYNERKIRKIKSNIEVQNKVVNNIPKKAPEGIVDQQKLRLESLKMDLRKAQKEQRELIKANSKVLDRNYDREAYNKMISNMGIKQLKSD